MPPANKKNAGLSDSDRVALDHARAEFEEDQRRAWLWGVIKRVAGWITACIAFVVVIWDFALRLWKALGP